MSFPDELESTSDPLSTEGDDLSFTWSQNFGSNYGRILSHLENNSHASRAQRFQPSPLAEQKVREVLDSMLQDSDLRSCQVAFSAEVQEETRMELEALDAPDDDEDDDSKPMGPHLDNKQSRRTSSSIPCR